jgi:hypothetical protein
MLKAVVVAAAFGLMAAPAFAANCSSSQSAAAGPVNGQQGAASPYDVGNDPAGTSCEVLVLPSGREVVQNGPNLGDSGGIDAPHEGR